MAATNTEMTHRERAMALLHYEPYDHLPVVHFGFWEQTLQKWIKEGHLNKEEFGGWWSDGSPADLIITEKIGFDFNWYSTFSPSDDLRPGFKSEVIKEFPDGSKHVRDGVGATLYSAPGAGSIPAHVDHLLKDRAAWEEHYKWRYVWDETRVTKAQVRTGAEMTPFDEGGLEYLQKGEWDTPLGLLCGSLYGKVRNVLGMEGAGMMAMLDPELLDEIVTAVADICYQNVKYTLEAGAKFDFAHFWEDICFKSGPLITPPIFNSMVGPHYKRITDLVNSYGIDIVSLDCDGMIDFLIPTWIENGVNTMFPIEVGTWNADITPWREKFGKELRGVGGMNKTVFAHDRAAIDAEIERLKPQIALGGFIPCPDHRIAPDAKWDLVRYYGDRMHEEFA